MRTMLMMTALIALAANAAAQAPAPAAKPTQPPVCNNCHKPEAGIVGGYFDNVAFKSQSIQVNLGTATEIVRFDPKTLKVIDAGDAKSPEHLRDVKKGHEARIAVVEKDGQKFATSISFKGPIKTPPEKLIGYDAVAKLVAQGPLVGNVTLIDSRPLPRFQEGSIPSAINLPYPTFDKLTDRLPADKSQLTIFFCQGVTCMMSPMSLRKAEALGYTNVKVYREGVPEWQTKDYLVTQPQFVKEAYVDKGIPVVLLDVRSAEEATSGHIIGAVGLPAAAVKANLRQFPEPKLKAPIVVYGGRDNEAAIGVARQLIKAGQTNVQVLSGGLLGWQAAGFKIESGVPAATKVAYVPKPRPGSIPADEFKTLATKTPLDVLILDVRNTDEANAGMIKGAMLVPDEEIVVRMIEIPKDKRIITHCATGVRAEMAYHKLKDAGYKVGFLNADLEIAGDGTFKLTPKL